MRLANARSSGFQLPRCWLTYIALAGALNWSSMCLASGRSRLVWKSQLHFASCEMSHRLESLHWQRMPMLYEACTSTFLQFRILLAVAQVQHLIGRERLVFGFAPLPRVAKRPQHSVLFAGRLDRSTAAAGTCPSCLLLAPLLLLPLLYQVNSQG